MRLIHWLASLLVTVTCATAQAGTLDYTTYYHNDHLGSPAAATDERGDVLWRAHYRPYGERQEDPKSANFGNLGYTGHAQDPDSQLVYAGARYYDPLIGRFLAVDPAPVMPGAPGSFNRFNYAANNPYRYNDPSGQVPLDTVWDFGNVVYDLGKAAVGAATGNSAMVAEGLADAALDTAAMAVPYLPAGSSKLARAGLDKVDDVAKRPSGFRKQTVQDAWDDAADGSKQGTKVCPTCTKEVEVAPGQGRRDWDVDHQPKWSDRDLSGMDRKQVLDEYNKDVRLRCPSCNRSDN